MMRRTFCKQFTDSSSVISYWYDVWGEAPLRKMKDRLSRPIRQHISLKEAITEEPDINSPFIGTVPVLYDHDDELIWRWSASGQYSAGSVYKLLITAGKTRWGFREVWAAAVPSKIQIFVALLLEDRILTREALQRRNINCEEQCVMCDTNTIETSYHLFFQCANAKDVWARVPGLMHIMDSVQDTWKVSLVRYCSTQGNQKKVWIGLFMAVLWSLWRQRNEVIFKGTRLPTRIVANRAVDDARLWMRFCRNGKKSVSGGGTGSGS